jgi:hypothetical protein
VTAKSAEIRGQRLTADAREGGPVRPRIIGRNDFGQTDVGSGVLDDRKTSGAHGRAALPEKKQS